ncbi:MAG TPA: GntR family transcriptional regulator [Terrimesophilobacter sp.]|nr:GntR family transcriptional regulator [Terrimesophilobacter sp.]
MHHTTVTFEGGKAAMPGTGGPRVRAATEALRTRIESGEWPVGSRIPTEPELGEQLGVGRSTVREAVRSLTTLGMLEPLTARGTFVRAVTPRTELLSRPLAEYDPAELLGLQRALSVEAAQSAAARRTRAHLEAMDAALHHETQRRVEGLNDEIATVRSGEADHVDQCTRFHGLIARSSGSRLLIDIDESVSTALAETGIASQVAAATDPAVRVAEHDRILTAIRDREPGLAAHLMALHVDAALRTISATPIITELTSLLGVVAELPQHRGAS